MKRLRNIGWMMLTLVLVHSYAIAQWQTKWYEVNGKATIVLGNSKDIHDDINVSPKKKLVMDATLDALQNAINFRLNPVISTQAYKTILEKDYLSINDHLIDLLAVQGIVWQRQRSPEFIRDESNPNKWTVLIHGLVKKANQETPPPVVTVEEPPVTQRIPEVIPEVESTPEPVEEVVVKKKDKQKKAFQKFLIGLNAGASYEMPTSIELDNGGYVDINENIGLHAGIRLPLARNFVIGADYMYNELEFGSDFGFGSFGSQRAHHRGGGGRSYNDDYDFDATHYATMTGFGFTMGSLRNFINPSIGAFYQRGDILDYDTEEVTGELLKRGATLGLDIGKGRLKFGIEATAFWLSVNGAFSGFGDINRSQELLSDINWEEVNWRFGASIKLFL